MVTKTYVVTLPINARIFNIKEYTSLDNRVKIIFRWFPLSELDNIDLNPTFLRKALQKMLKHTERIIWEDN
jgi:hypothetical protein